MATRKNGNLLVPFWRWIGKQIDRAYPSERSGYGSDEEAFRQRLREAERRHVSAIAARFAFSERWRTAIAVTIPPGGAFLAGLAKTLDAALQDSLQSWLIGIGLVMAFFGSVFVALTDHLRGKLVRDSLEVLDLAREAIDENGDLRGRLRESAALDDQRRFLIRAERSMRTAAIEIGSKAEIIPVIEAMFDASLNDLVGAIGFLSGERWVFSVFRKQKDTDGWRMRRIVVRRADRDGEAGSGRAWPKGYGFTGVAWSRKEEVVEADATLPETAKHYPVPSDMRRDHDSAFYISVAAIPLMVGGDVWGVLIATSDKKGRFRADPDNIRSQYVDTVRTVAQMICLQVTTRCTQAQLEGVADS